MSKYWGANPGGLRPKPAARPVERERERKMLAEALTLLRAGQLGRAIEICDAVLAFNPQQPDALHLGGSIALQQGRLY